jgi:diketogulonate reductase-like aldo/keto reductase
LTLFVPYRNVKRTLENLSAGDVELSTEDLAEIAQLLEKYPRKGARYVDGMEDVLLLWN